MDFDAYIREKGISAKKKVKPKSPFDNLNENEKWKIIKELLKDLGYIDE